MKTNNNTGMSKFCRHKLEEIAMELNSITKELNSLKKQEETLKANHSKLRTTAMIMMRPGDEFETKFGTLSYRDSMINRRISKDLIKTELLKRGFSKEYCEELIASSIKTVQVCPHVSFSLKPKKAKRQ